MNDKNVSHEIYDDFGVRIQYVYRLRHEAKRNYWTAFPYPISKGDKVEENDE